MPDQRKPTDQLYFGLAVRTYIDIVRAYKAQTVLSGRSITDMLDEADLAFEHAALQYGVMLPTEGIDELFVERRASNPPDALVIILDSGITLTVLPNGVVQTQQQLNRG